MMWTRWGGRKNGTVTVARTVIIGYNVEDLVNYFNRKNEKNVPAEKETSQARTRLSQENAIKDRKKCPGQKKSKGQKKTNGVMLKKIYRINKTRELQRVYRTGKTVHTPALVIKFLPAEKFRTAFVVSKKVSKKAVDRNRIKRAIREEIRLKVTKLAKGEYMLVAKPSAAQDTNTVLRKQLLEALIKAGLCQK